MNETRDNYGPAARVHVENTWYDRPRDGVADIGGVPHRFHCPMDEAGDDYLDTVLVWPIDASELVLEKEQWRIFCAWYARWEAGTAGTDSHPGKGRIDARWDALERQLRPSRNTPPAEARHARFVLEWLPGSRHYTPDGPGYAMRWWLLGTDETSS